MKNQKNNSVHTQKLTQEQRVDYSARVAALRAEANALSKALREDEALTEKEKVAEQVVEASVEEVEVDEEVAETPAEEEEVAEQVAEASVEEVEVDEEVAETPAEEEEVTEEVTEAPAEEVEVAEEVAETPAEEEEVTEEVTEAPVEEVEVDEEVAETPAEEVEVAEEVAEASVEEEEVTEEVTEAPAEEVEVAEEVEEASVEEEEVTEEVTEAPVEEVEVAEEVAEIPVEEEEVTEEVTEAPAEEEEVAQEVAETPVEEEIVGQKAQSTKKKFKFPKWNLKYLLVGIGLFVWTIVMVTLIAINSCNNNGAQVPPTNSDTQTEQPGTVISDNFKNSVVNIAKTLTNDEGITANVDILLESIDEDKLVELVGKYGELSVQKAIAEYLVFVPEIKMNQYISNNGLNYNPNATADYDNKLFEATEAYKEATGKNPDGALMSLDGYDTFKFNREAMKNLIIKSGDTALLTWYEVKTEGYDLMVAQNKDTEAALAYKESVKEEILTSYGAIKLLELQLEQEANGTLAVMDPVSMQYTVDYNNFILNNYIYVIVK